MDESRNKFRTVGRVESGLIDDEALGEVCEAVFPGIDRTIRVPISGEVMVAAGLEPAPGTYFSALANLAGTTAEEIQPEEIEALMGQDNK